jgi:hypothetical protein
VFVLHGVDALNHRLVTQVKLWDRPVPAAILR